MVGRNYSFKMTNEEYEIYETWCKENGLNTGGGAIGGAVSFEIIPTSLGDIVTAYATVIVKDELGEVSYDKNGNMKKRRIECKIRDI